MKKFLVQLVKTVGGGKILASKKHSLDRIQRRKRWVDEEHRRRKYHHEHEHHHSHDHHTAST